MSDPPKILVVDDEQDCIDCIRDILADTSYELLTATDGDQGLKVARDQNPQLIILDVHMPKKDGFTVFNELRQNDCMADIPVIMLTAIAEKTGIGFSAENMGEFIGSEPEIYIDKPIEPMALREAVDKLMNK